MKSRIYIDTCCVIQSVKGSIDNRDGFSQRDLDYIKMILEAGLKGDVKLFTSSVTVTECLHTGDGTNIPEDAKRLFKTVLTSGHIMTLKYVDLFVVERARDFRWVHGINLKPLDSIHLASALETKCDEFWTGDCFGGVEDEKRKHLSETFDIRVILPSETTLLPSDYKQRNLFEHAPKQIGGASKLRIRKKRGLSEVSKITAETLSKIGDLIPSDENEESSQSKRISIDSKKE